MANVCSRESITLYKLIPQSYHQKLFQCPKNVFKENGYLIRNGNNEFCMNGKRDSADKKCKKFFGKGK